MRVLAFLAIAVFFTISVLVSTRREWFGFLDGIPGGDKLGHFFGAGLLSFFVVLGFSALSAHGRPLGPMGSLAAAALLVTLEEVIQLAIPSRVFSLDDLAWSLVGVLISGLVAAGIKSIGHPPGQISRPASNANLEHIRNGGSDIDVPVLHVSLDLRHLGVDEVAIPEAMVRDNSN